MGYIFQGEKHSWEVVIGLEVHAQVVSNSKLFSGSSTKFGAEPNTQVALLDAGLPGTLPVLNRECVHQTIKTGLAIDAEINKRSVFDRKNYFYPDLPLGYQISQLYHPIVGKGKVEITLSDGSVKEIGVTRIHLEQDAGKSIHDQSPTESFIDLNRAGIALMEIVSEPDIRSPEEAAAYLKKLRSILRYLGTCDGDMEKGSLRCDANVSVRPVGETKFGTRAEIKNLNSVKFLTTAIEHEVERQVEILESGGEVVQETRLFDTKTGETRSMRSKEDSHDYRYFPDPDLLPLEVSDELIESIKQSLPELPDAKRKRYVSSLGLSEYDASVITAEKEIANYFEEVANKVNPKLAANWITAELFGRLNKLGKSITECPISTEHMTELVGLIEDSTISGKIAKEVFDIMFSTGKSPEQIVEEKGLKQITDVSSIEGFVEEVIANNPDKVAEYKSGKDKLFGFFVGQVMKLSQGKANPKVVNDLLKDKMKNSA